jgi:hypothetical protein
LLGRRHPEGITGGSFALLLLLLLVSLVRLVLLLLLLLLVSLLRLVLLLLLVVEGVSPPRFAAVLLLAALAFDFAPGPPEAAAAPPLPSPDAAAAAAAAGFLFPLLLSGGADVCLLGFNLGAPLVSLLAVLPWFDFLEDPGAAGAMLLYCCIISPKLRTGCGCCCCCCCCWDACAVVEARLPVLGRIVGAGMSICPVVAQSMPGRTCWASILCVLGHLDQWWKQHTLVSAGNKLTTFC